MKTFFLRSCTNYGEVVHIVNADNEDEVRNIVRNNNTVWDGCEIEEINTNIKGVVCVGGGDGRDIERRITYARQKDNQKPKEHCW